MDRSSWGKDPCRRAFAGAAAVSLFVACGGAVAGPSGDSGGAATTGQVAGAPLPGGDVVALLPSEQSQGVPTPTVEVALTNLSGACGLLQSVADGGATPGNVTSLVLVVFAESNSPAAGTYPVVSSCAPNCGTNFAQAGYSATDASCNTVRTEDATSGTVVLSSASATTIDGSFDLTLQSGDHVTGTFTAPICNVGTVVQGAPTCQ